MMRTQEHTGMHGETSHNNRLAKQRLRVEIAAQVASFLARGGRIERASSTLNHRSRSTVSFGEVTGVLPEQEFESGY